MRKYLVIFLGILILFAVGCKKSGSDKNSKIKAAFVYVGSVSDGGWTHAHDEGRIALSNMGISTSYVENVLEGDESERVISNFAEKGYDVIFTTSFGYMKPTLNVAKDYPNTVFMNCSGYKRAKNVGTYFGRMYQAKYLVGIIAGKMTKSNIIGYIAPFPIPEVIRHINAFTVGVRSVNKNARVKIIWTNSWFDPAKEKEAALALIKANVDVVATGADSTAPLVAAQENGVFCIGYDSDARDIAPNSYLTSPIWYWEVVYKDVIDKIKSKKVKDWSNVDYWNGFDTGVVGLAKMTDLVPEDVQKIINNKIEDIKNTGDNIFLGPLKEQDGNLKVKESERISDEELLSMNYFLEGVDGKIPQ